MIILHFLAFATCALQVFPHLKVEVSEFHANNGRCVCLRLMEHPTPAYLQCMLTCGPSPLAFGCGSHAALHAQISGVCLQCCRILNLLKTEGTIPIHYQVHSKDTGQTMPRMLTTAAGCCSSLHMPVFCSTATYMQHPICMRLPLQPLWRALSVVGGCMVCPHLLTPLVPLCFCASRLFP